MSYLGSWKINDQLCIPATCHRFSTGAAYAATSITYTIYEDDSTSHLVENVDMVPASPFDGIVGFYLAKIQLTAATGFEKGKNYTVVIKATVDSVAAITTHTFQIEAEVDSNSISDTTALNAATPASVQNIAADGSGFTDLGDTRIAHLDADISSRLAPDGTLAVVTALNSAYDAAKAAAPASDVTAIKTVTDKMATMIEAIP